MTSKNSMPVELTIENDQPMATSNQIARNFGKKHYHVLDEIRKINEDLKGEVPDDWHKSNFRFMSVDVKIGNGAIRKDPVCLLTRDGFSMLAMGFTGKKALLWRKKYIDAFNAMEAALKKTSINLDEVNHEYYTKRAMREHNGNFNAFLRDSLPQVHFLQNEPVNINGVNFFGGTMRTDFKGEDGLHMRYAENNMSDFRLITANGLRPLSARETIGFHQEFLKALKSWLSKKINGQRVVVTHHVPFENQLSKFLDSPLQPAFIAYDAPPLINKYQPDLWICGHTHESFKHDFGKTQIISNQLGYPLRGGGYESGDDFDKYGIGLQL